MRFKMSSAICFNLDQSKILSSGNRLIDSTDARQVQPDDIKQLCNQTTNGDFIASYPLFM